MRAGFEAAGYEVIGTATSGQAARNLGDGAQMASRTVASLAWRLEHGSLAFSDRHVVVLDEGGMTPDVDLVRLLTAVERAGAKLVVEGDDRHLGAVGPSGVTLARVEESERALRRASDPHARPLGERQSRLAHDARQLEARQQARADFIAANPDVMDRIVELSRAVEIERAADRRHRMILPSAARPHVCQRHSSICRVGLRTPRCAGALPAVRA